MACRDTIGTNNQMRMETSTQVSRTEDSISLSTGPFYFGVDSATRADTVLQNNLTLFDWVTRNKMYPNYWGRYIGGEKTSLMRNWISCIKRDAKSLLFTTAALKTR